MDRKWRLNRGAHETVESPVEFKRKYVDVLDVPRGASLARLTDVYAVYTVLHIERRAWTLAYSASHGAYYFTTKVQREEGGGEGGGEGPAEDVEGGDAVASGDSSSDSSGDSSGDRSGDEGSDASGDLEDIAVKTGAQDTKETVYCDAAQTEAGASSRGTQVLVPVSSGLRYLTPRVIHSLCALGHGVAQQVFLCLCDSNGVVTRCCLYDYIQGPLSTRGVEAALVSHGQA
jgi:hypothetical protein